MIVIKYVRSREKFLYTSSSVNYYYYFFRVRWRQLDIMHHLDRAKLSRVLAGCSSFFCMCVCVCARNNLFICSLLKMNSVQVRAFPLCCMYKNVHILLWLNINSSVKRFSLDCDYKNCTDLLWMFISFAKLISNMEHYNPLYL